VLRLTEPVSGFVSSFVQRNKVRNGKRNMSRNPWRVPFGRFRIRWGTVFKWLLKNGG
jgi:hypothetical protein